MCTFRPIVRPIVALLVSQTHDINWAFITGRIAWDSAHWADYLSIIVLITPAALASEFNLFAPVGRRGKVEGVRRAVYRFVALRNCIDCREGYKFFFAFAVLLVIRYRRHGGRRFRGGCRRRGRGRRPPVGRGGRGRGERCRRRGGRGRGGRCRRRGGRGRGGVAVGVGVGVVAAAPSGAVLSSSVCSPGRVSTVGSFPCCIVSTFCAERASSVPSAQTAEPNPPAGTERPAMPLRAAVQKISLSSACPPLPDRAYYSTARCGIGKGPAPSPLRNRWCATSLKIRSSLFCRCLSGFYISYIEI